MQMRKRMQMQIPYGCSQTFPFLVLHYFSSNGRSTAERQAELQIVRWERPRPSHAIPYRTTPQRGMHGICASKIPLKADLPRQNACLCSTSPSMRASLLIQATLYFGSIGNMVVICFAC